MALKDVLKRLNPLTADERIVDYRQFGSGDGVWRLKSGDFTSFDVNLAAGTITPSNMNNVGLMYDLPLPLPAPRTVDEAIASLEQLLPEVKRAMKGVKVSDEGLLHGNRLYLLQLPDGRRVAYQREHQSELDIRPAFIAAHGREGTAISLKESHYVCRLYDADPALSFDELAAKIDAGTLTAALEDVDVHPYAVIDRYRHGQRLEQTPATSPGAGDAVDEAGKPSLPAVDAAAASPAEAGLDASLEL